MSSAIRFSLEKSKILTSGNGLNLKKKDIRALSTFDVNVNFKTMMGLFSSVEVFVRKTKS